MRKGMNGENIVFKSVYMARTLLYIIAIYVGGGGGIHGQNIVLQSVYMTNSL